MSAIADKGHCTARADLELVESVARRVKCQAGNNLDA